MVSFNTMPIATVRQDLPPTNAFQAVENAKPRIESLPQKDILSFPQHEPFHQNFPLPSCQ